MDEIKRFDLSNRLYFLLVILVIGFLAYILVTMGFWATDDSRTKEIVFSGEGKAVVKPDIALVSFAVSTKAETSAGAVNENNQKMNAVIKAIKDAGVNEKDIQTTIYNLQPWYDYTRNGSVFKGYTLEQQVSVKIRNLDKINNVLDKATSAGANNVGNLSFTVDDMEKVKAEARTKAIAEAKKKAEVLAKESGLKLGKLINVSEGGNYPTPIYGMGASNTMMEKSSVAPDIQAGQSEVTVSISLTYQIK